MKLHIDIDLKDEQIIVVKMIKTVMKHLNMNADNLPFTAVKNGNQFLIISECLEENVGLFGYIGKNIKIKITAFFPLSQDGIYTFVPFIIFESLGKERELVLTDNDNSTLCFSMNANNGEIIKLTK